MQEWFSPEQILTHNRGELPETVRSFNRLAEQSGWRGDDGKAKPAQQKGGGWLYHLSVLPAAIQIRLEAAQAPQDETTKRNAVWENYEKLSAKHKEKCQRQLQIVDRQEQFVLAGHNEIVAARMAGKEYGVSGSSIFNWKKKLRGVAKADRLAALAPQYGKPTGNKKEIHPDAWDALKSDYLRPEKPSFTSCYRRVVKAAEKQGWGEIPIRRTLQRRLEKEVPAATIVMLREGKDVAKNLYPAQRRSVAHFKALQAVNMDGHTFDVFVQKPNGKTTRVCLVAIQDLYSRKIIAWRIADNENKHTVRLVIGDMVERYGIPEKIFLDNGRSFASKWITGGSASRYRFKIKEEEPQGLLVTLGVEHTFTSPYHGQAKPIERGFRDLCDTIAKHPFCAGAYTGNSPTNQPANYGKRAIDEDLFKDFVDTQIAEHNARTDRNTEMAKGESFDTVFERSYEDPSNIISMPTAAQKALWLLAAERVRPQRKSGEIHLFGNRYWHPKLTNFTGKPVTVRFDPDHLHDGIRVYDVQDRLVCEAASIGDTGFDDVEAARTHAANRNKFVKLEKQKAELHQQLSAQELARIYADGEPAKPKRKLKPGVPRLVTEGGKKVEHKKQPQQEWGETQEANFSRGLKLISGGD